MISFRGRGVVSLKVVSTYIPQDNKGTYTVYQHHLQYYTEKTKNPIANFDDELSSSLKKWIEKGDQVILMIDENKDSLSSKKEYFRSKMEAIGINKLIINQHPRLQPPQTRFPGTK